jgi:hypothetical protein
MKRRWKLTRRGFVRSVAAAGAGAAALPLLTSGGKTASAANGFPNRFIVFFSPNGSIPNEWRPDGGETDFTMRRILAPLEPYREHLLILDGLDMRSTSSGPGDGHQKGMGHMLTGRELLPGDTGGGCDSCAPVSWASGISVDQEIANQIAGDTAFRSLELGVRNGNSSNVWTRMCYRGASEPLPPEDDPYAVFERVFGELTGDPFGLERRRAMRQSVVDYLNQDYSDLQSRVSREDALRMEQHIEGIRDIERRLTSGTLGASCVAPELGSRIDIGDIDNMPAVGRMQMDMATMALACDLTRVVSLQWTKSVGGAASPWLGISDGHHSLSHEGDGNTDAVEKLVQINTWYAEQFGYLLQQLQSIPEGDGTLLDNTCVIWVNELGKGNSHTRNDLPIVMAGSAGGYFRTGRCLRYDDTPHNDLLVTLTNAYGVEQETFGDPRFCNGPLTELLV